MKMAVTLDLSARLESFDVSATSSVGQRWIRWKRSFDYYVVARDFTYAQQKHAPYCIWPDLLSRTFLMSWRKLKVTKRSVHLMLIFSHM